MYRSHDIGKIDRESADYEKEEKTRERFFFYRNKNEMNENRFI
jgi:hypothetical protein